MVRICLADCTDYEWAVMFEAESLFGKTAQELCDIREKSEEDFMQLVQSLQFTEIVDCGSQGGDLSRRKSS